MYAAEDACDEVIDALGVPARKILTSATTAIAIGSEGAGFEGFLDRFPRARRKNVRHEVRAFAAAGATVTTCRLGDVLPRVAALMGAHQRKYGDLVTDAQMARYLRLQEAYLGETSTVFVEERDGDILGFTLYYAHGGTLYSRAGGFDPRRAAPYAYFNVSVYAPIRHAIERGLTTLDLGLGSYQAKRLRGADVTPLWSVVVPPERLEPEWQRVLGFPAPQAIGAGVASLPPRG
jgi:predicted N-acyltransferase